MGDPPDDGLCSKCYLQSIRGSYDGSDFEHEPKAAFPETPVLNILDKWKL